LNSNWAGSEHNKQRWGAKMNFSTAKLIMEKISDLMGGDYE
jgi:hypothetical protein